MSKKKSNADSYQLPVGILRNVPPGVYGRLLVLARALYEEEQRKKKKRKARKRRRSQ